MANTYCDHCGIGLREEDFASKKAIFDGADIFCAACFAEYREEEERKKRASQALAITSASRSGRHSAKTSGIHKRKQGRPTGRTTVRPMPRKKQKSTNPIVLLLFAMVAGALAAVAIYYVAESRRASAQPVVEPQPHAAPVEPQPQQLHPAENPKKPPPPPAPAPAEESGHVPRSLFGPGGEHSLPPR